MTDLFDGLFIYEMANNHQGSVAHGKRIVEEAARVTDQHGVRGAVKLQFRDLDTFIHPDFRGRDDVAHIPRFESTRLEQADFAELVNAIRDAGLLAVATPFDEASVQTCVDLGIDIIKVASCSATDWPLLTAIAAAGKPVIASTGGLDIYHIDSLVSFFRKRVPALGLMHCVSVYPTPLDQLRLNFMAKMIRRYPYLTVGYSGHEDTDDTDVVIAAIARGARFLERHFGVPTDDITLNKYSVNPEQLDAWVGAAQKARAICGIGEEKALSGAETESLLSLQRGVYAKKPIRKGQTLTAEDVFFAMPCHAGQLTSGDFGRLRARYVASNDYAANEQVRETPQIDDMHLLRGILHDAKGQIYEAGLQLGDDYTIEVSHHYGLDRFRETGCILLNLVNREYCEKLLIQLPGQGHPLHKHKLKEETFRLLWGDLTVHLNDHDVVLRPGDKLLIERDTPHGFSSRGGAIFSEVSTTSLPGDSYYEDPAIAELDPMQRKTVIEEW